MAKSKEAITDEKTFIAEGRPPQPSKNLVDGAEYWDFESNPKFIGIYKGEKYAEKEGENKRIGFLFTEYETNQDWLLSDSHAIAQAIEHPEAADVIEDEGYFFIEFLGQGKTSKGQKYNKFKISV